MFLHYSVWEEEILALKAQSFHKKKQFPLSSFEYFKCNGRTYYSAIEVNDILNAIEDKNYNDFEFLKTFLIIS